ncbi:hypothetical protein QOZ88_05770 [Blastococcus sp. BMG 814]|uniref:Uncharacterized protein n=1 Tax=Blastococcus carthaginiensis TaxID=3050034 RepID=A0ABT9I996_9ACTN|nr:hypothetical protein [Blastococcus carthaginiensis]MDP5182137.1 hypothetical protein [Blastococcus carthaginiensis]
MNATTSPPPAARIYAPATDTVELPSVRRGDVAPTAELHLLDLVPAVPHPAPRREARGLRHLRTSLRSAVTPAAVLGSGALAMGFVLVTYRLGEVLHALSTTGATP